MADIILVGNTSKSLIALAGQKGETAPEGAVADQGAVLPVPMTAFSPILQQLIAAQLALTGNVARKTSESPEFPILSISDPKGDAKPNTAVPVGEELSKVAHNVMGQSPLALAMAQAVNLTAVAQVKVAVQSGEPIPQEEIAQLSGNAKRSHEKKPGQVQGTKRDGTFKETKATAGKQIPLVLPNAAQRAEIELALGGSQDDAGQPSQNTDPSKVLAQTRVAAPQMPPGISTGEGQEEANGDKVATESSPASSLRAPASSVGQEALQRSEAAMEQIPRSVIMTLEVASAPSQVGTLKLSDKEESSQSTQDLPQRIRANIIELSSAVAIDPKPSPESAKMKSAGPPSGLKEEDSKAIDGDRSGGTEGAPNSKADKASIRQGSVISRASDPRTLDTVSVKELSGRALGGDSKVSSNQPSKGTSIPQIDAEPSTVLQKSRSQEGEAQNKDATFGPNVVIVKNDGSQGSFSKEGHSDPSEKENIAKQPNPVEKEEVRVNNAPKEVAELPGQNTGATTSAKDHAEVLKHQTSIMTVKVDARQDVQQVPQAKSMPILSELLSGVHEQIAKEISLKVLSGTSEIRIMLKPEALGNVTVNIRMEEGTMVARIDVSQPNVRTALEANLPQLREALVNKGIQVDRIDVMTSAFSSSRESSNQQRERTKSGLKRGEEAEAVETYEAGRFLGYNTMDYLV